MTLRGWKEITQHTKLSANGIKTLARREKNPFPLIYVLRKPFVSINLFNKWIEAENKIQKKAVNS